LKQSNTMIFKNAFNKLSSGNFIDEEELAMTCQHCGRRFKFIVKGKQDG
jgi:hypothetical protein